MEVSGQVAGVTGGCSGIGHFGRGGLLPDLKHDGWDYIMNLNARGVLLCYRKVSRELVKARIGGSLVAISPGWWALERRHDPGGE